MGEWYRFPAARLQIFSRLPQAGISKTRLIPALGAEGAAQLQSRLLLRTVTQAVQARLAPVELWCTPDCSDPFFQSLAATHDLALFAQCDGDLGRRMDHALDSALKSADFALLIGTDCPAMRPVHMATCLEGLETGQDAALLPASDGGYVAIGLRRPASWLFEKMPWGGSDVLTHTRNRLNQQGWTWLEPALLWDVDEPADWLRLQREMPELVIGL